ncbi:phosphoribosylglycinamide formyltransferase [Dongia deserti]|uniref:phosphoribosylglycinamide formyltransferase n=1 Tax=Dongia deserti TaxID=2268030 RepID=UPI000E65A3CC|nr:phosphoribosylglycinamide formyltransferase [Dongia deserti]
MPVPLKVAVLISGRGSNLQALIDAFKGPDSPVRIVLVLSNKADALGLERAAKAGLKTEIIDHRAFATRDDFDIAMDREIRAAGAEFVALAGFMRLLTPQFVTTWQDRLINIHPALLPAFPGLDTHRRALNAGVRFHGATVHFVRHETDMGPIIAQAAVPVLSGDDESTLAARVLATEHKLYPLALRLIAEGRVRVEEERAIVSDEPAADGVLFNPALPQ